MELPAEQVPVKDPKDPLQILGEFKPVGGLGIGVTVTIVWLEGLLQAVFVVRMQAA